MDMFLAHSRAMDLNFLSSSKSFPLSILLNFEEVDEPPVTPSVLLDLPPLLHPPPPLVRQLKHVLVDVAVLLHDLRVLLGHHVDHNTTGLTQPGHRGKAAKRDVFRYRHQKPNVRVQDILPATCQEGCARQ